MQEYHGLRTSRGSFSESGSTARASRRSADPDWAVSVPPLSPEPLAVPSARMLASLSASGGDAGGTKEAGCSVFSGVDRRGAFDGITGWTGLSGLPSLSTQSILTLPDREAASHLAGHTTPTLAFCTRTTRSVPVRAARDAPDPGGPARVVPSLTKHGLLPPPLGKLPVVSGQWLVKRGAIRT